MVCYRCGAPYEKTEYCPSCGAFLEGMAEYERTRPAAVAAQDAAGARVSVQQRQAKETVYQLEVRDTGGELPASTHTPQQRQAPLGQGVNIHIYNTSVTNNQVTQNNIQYIDNTAHVNYVDMLHRPAGVSWQQEMPPILPPFPSTQPERRATLREKLSKLDVRGIVVFALNLFGMIVMRRSQSHLESVVFIIAVGFGIAGLLTLEPVKKYDKVLTLVASLFGGVCLLLALMRLLLWLM